MKASEVRNLDWIPVMDWSRLPATYRSTRIVFPQGIVETMMTTKKDIEDYVEIVFKDIARKLNIPYEELRPILMEENKSFFSALNRIYDEQRVHAFIPRYEGLVSEEKLLRVPSTASVEKTLNDFCNLNERDKMEFLKQIEQLLKSK